MLPSVRRSAVTMRLRQEATLTDGWRVEEGIWQVARRVRRGGDGGGGRGSSGRGRHGASEVRRRGGKRHRCSSDQSMVGVRRERSATAADGATHSSGKTERMRGQQETLHLHAMTDQYGRLTASITLTVCKARRRERQYAKALSKCASPLVQQRASRTEVEACEADARCGEAERRRQR